MSSSPNWAVSRPNLYPSSCGGVLELPRTSALAHPPPQLLWPLAEPCYPPPQPSNPDVGGGNRGQMLAEGRVAGHQNQPSTQAQPYQLKDSGRGEANVLTCPTPSRHELPSQASWSCRSQVQAWLPCESCWLWRLCAQSGDVWAWRQLRAAARIQEKPL